VEALEVLLSDIERKYCLPSLVHRAILEQLSFVIALEWMRG
jgi:hypothetical protein